MSSLFRHNLSNASLYKLVSFLFWNWLYVMTVEHAKERGPEWCSRVLTVLHGTVAVLIGYSQCNLPLSTRILSRRILPIQYMLMIWSWGYFAFDLLWCLVYWSESRVILMHHTAALLSITRYMHKDHTGCSFACTLVLMELTNPLLQARWFLKVLGQGHTLLYTIVEVLYLVLFLFLRGVVGTVAIYYILTSRFFDIEEKVMSLALYIVSMIFIYDIIGYIRYKYKREIVRQLLILAIRISAYYVKSTIFMTDIKREFYYATQLTTPNERLAQTIAETHPFTQGGGWFRCHIL